MNTKDLPKVTTPTPYEEIYNILKEEISTHKDKYENLTWPFITKSETIYVCYLDNCEDPRIFTIMRKNKAIIVEMVNTFNEKVRKSGLSAYDFFVTHYLNILP